ncbi:NCS2 family permease [Algicola sagamiensis]|uniref:NCS2 family permease n=1 Tax=Algicola sagamiensis TaxID=163869 RepID=UPI0003609E8B|nr:NCS2 family permease [Algicola sagamiensis]
MSLLEKLFKIEALGSSVKRECVAGVTTFLTMAYIIFVNPQMLADAGMDPGAVFVATCLAAALGCFLMGVLANYPVALAPGMGLNAFFTYVVVMEMGYSWEAALGAVFLSGILFILLSLFKVREWIMNSIPVPLKLGIGAGIGLFLALIALKSVGLVVASQSTLVTLGDLTQPSVLLAILGFFIIIAFAHFDVKASVILGVISVTLLSLAFGMVEYQGIVSLPPSLEPTWLKMDIKAAFDISMLSVIFTFLFIDLFDTSGTLVAVTHKAKLMKEDGTIPNLSKALLADSGASVVGATLGTSTTTSYIESASGVAVGGRTGLTAVVTGCCFLLALFFSPLAGMVPVYATAGALLYVSVLMLGSLQHIEWDKLTDAVPVGIILIMTPLSFSISEGIALGFISYAVINLMTNQWKQVSVSVWVLAALFISRYAFA